MILFYNQRRVILWRRRLRRYHKQRHLCARASRASSALCREIPRSRYSTIARPHLPCRTSKDWTLQPPDSKSLRAHATALACAPSNQRILTTHRVRAMRPMYIQLLSIDSIKTHSLLLVALFFNCDPRISRSSFLEAASTYGLKLRAHFICEQKS